MDCVTNFFIKPPQAGMSYCEKAKKNFTKGNYCKSGWYWIKGVSLITPLVGNILWQLLELYRRFQRNNPPFQTLSQKIKNTAEDTKWFTNYNLSFFFQLIQTHYPTLFAPTVEWQSITPETAHDKITRSLARDEAKKANEIAFYAHIGGNHWGLIFIDKTKKTIEYYDSKHSYGNGKEFDVALGSIATHLGYTFVKKIEKCLQSDSYQCGPWTCYFLEKRMQDPEFNFNSLNPDDAPQMMANYRVSINNAMKVFQEKILAKRQKK